MLATHLASQLAEGSERGGSTRPLAHSEDLHAGSANLKDAAVLNPFG
jgi:hypothetical protein